LSRENMSSETRKIITQADYSRYVGFDPAISGWRVIQERRTFTLGYGKVSFA
jgi:hypothetical protein